MEDSLSLPILDNGYIYIHGYIYYIYPCMYVCIFVLLHKATPVDKLQLSYMVNKLYKLYVYIYVRVCIYIYVYTHTDVRIYECTLDINVWSFESFYIGQVSKSCITIFFIVYIQNLAAALLPPCLCVFMHVYTPK